MIESPTPTMNQSIPHSHMAMTSPITMMAPRRSSRSVRASRSFMVASVLVVGALVGQRRLAGEEPVFDDAVRPGTRRIARAEVDVLGRDVRAADVATERDLALE